MDIAEAFRRSYLAALKSISGFKVLIIDSHTESTISQLIPNSVNVSLGVSATMRIETLNNVSGNAMPWTSCMVIASSTDENIQRLSNELRDQHFGDLYIYLTTKPSREHLETLAREDKKERIRNIRILFTFFHPEYNDMFSSIDMSVYNALATSDAGANNDPKNIKINRTEVVSDMSPSESMMFEAESLLSALRAMGRTPFCVRHTNTPTTNDFLKQFDRVIGNDGRWSGFKYDARGQPPPGSVDTSTLPFELIIMDRRDDVVTPMLTDFTLSGILREIGGLKGGVVRFKLDQSEQQFPFNTLIDPTGMIGELGAVPFPDVQIIVQKRVKELIEMINDAKDTKKNALANNSNSPQSKLDTVTAVQDTLVKQDQIMKDRKLLSELNSIIHIPSTIIRNQKWAKWSWYVFGIAICASKKKQRNDKAKADGKTKEAIRLFNTALADTEINLIAYAMLKLVFTFVAGFPETVLKPSSGGVLGANPSTQGGSKQDTGPYSLAIRSSCLETIRRFYCSKSLTPLSDNEAESIIDRFALYSSRNYKGVDWFSISQHPLNKPSKVSKASGAAQPEEDDGMFSLDFMAKEAPKPTNITAGKSDNDDNELVPKWMFKYVPSSVSLSTLAVRNEHKDIVPVYEHLTDKRVLEVVNSKVKAVHDVMIYIIGGASSYEHFVPTQIGRERNPKGLADRERLASLLTGHCIVGGSGILTPRELVNDVTGKPFE